MSVRSRFIVAVLWIASLALVGYAQSIQLNPPASRFRPAPPTQLTLEPPTIFSGADLGFRAEGWQGNARTGTFVVRIDGEWVEARSVMKTLPAITR